MPIDKRRSFGTLLFALTLVSCETAYRPTLRRLDPVGSNSTKVSAENLVAYVEEYATPNKSERAFDANLAEAGILPVLLLLENRGKTPYQITEIELRDEKGHALKQLGADEAASQVSRGGFREAVGWSLVVPIVTIPLAAGLSAAHTVGVNSEISRDIKRKTFEQENLKESAQRSGFVFYQLESDRRKLGGLLLVIQALNLGTNHLISVSSPLPDVQIARDD